MPVKRPLSDRPVVPKDLAELADRCIYMGSIEHKDRRSWLGLPRPRRSGNPEETATICPLVANSERERATEWVRSAIRQAQFVPTDWSGGFPRRIWHRDESGQYWYGFLTNCGAGERPVGHYKGWPIDEDEWREIFR